MFVQRELLVLVQQSPNWQDHPLAAGRIELATHMIRIELEHSGHPNEPVRWAFAHKAGWLTVQIEQLGWLKNLPERQFDALTTAMAGWYKLAGVDVVREQVEAGLAGTGWSYAVEQKGLGLRPAPRAPDEVIFPMYDTVRLNLKRMAKDSVVTPLVPPSENLVFARLPIRWDAWVAAWLRDQRGQAPKLLAVPLALVPAVDHGENAASPEHRNGEALSDKSALRKELTE